ncbi:MAG TPA: M43 family zinc metalloprotease, partial [Saprospiraceae bacterium]|nr:M43 family zinc metalloprotease [Saprospiraceae bacterium]
VVLHSSMGSVASPNPGGGSYARGRTLTHEVGHWLNLRHIWGDATCGNDQVADTPVHNTSNGGCPTYPHYSTC